MTKVRLISFTFVIVSGCQLVLAQSGKEKTPETVPDIVTTVASPAQARTIRSLLDVIGETPGGTQQTEKALDAVVAAYRKALPGVPEASWSELTIEIKRDFGPDKMAEFLTPIYASRFSIQEIKELTAFFKTPVGQKWSELLPDLQRASYNAAKSLGYLTGERLNQRLKTKGLVSPKN